MLSPTLVLKSQSNKEAEHRCQEGNPLSALSRIVLNVIDACNRSCSFCPRSDQSTFPSRPQNRMSEESALTLSMRMSEARFEGTVSITGWGEPLLHPQILRIIDILRTDNNIRIELQTNGDALRPTTIEGLEKTVDLIIVNQYDNKKIELPEGDKWKLLVKNNTTSIDTYNFNNRAGALATTHVLPLTSPCYLPFYKMAVDYDLAVYLCDYDWNKRAPITSLVDSTLLEAWMHPTLMHHRKALYTGDRSNVPCSMCDAQGTLYGKKQADILIC